LLNQPFQDTLVTKHELSKALHHAQSLKAEVVHRFSDQVDIVTLDPIGFGVHIHPNTVACLPFQSLSFQHVNNGVDSAECSRPPASGTAMDDNGSLAFRLRFVQGDGVRGGHETSGDLVGLFDDTEQVRWMGWDTKIRPICVLQLGDFPHWLEWETSVGKCELANVNEWGLRNEGM
jgi:hypothetical protein